MSYHLPHVVLLKVQVSAGSENSQQEQNLRLEALDLSQLSSPSPQLEQIIRFGITNAQSTLLLLCPGGQPFLLVCTARYRPNVSIYPSLLYILVPIYKYTQ